MTDTADTTSAPLRVLVLGASGGLGTAIAAEYRSRGAQVFGVGRDAERLQVSVGDAHVVGDLRDPAAVETAVSAAVAAMGGVDHVVNAAGVVAFGAVGELDVDVVEELFLINTMMPMLLAKAALAHLGRGGVLVNVSGLVAEQGFPGMAAYAGSKAAVMRFDEGLAREARRAGVRVIDARPPHTETGLAGRAIAGTAPRFPEGLTAAQVATVIVDGAMGDATDLPSTAFG